MRDSLLLSITLLSIILLELHYYPFAVNLDRCVGSCTSLNGLSDKACVPNKIEYLNLTGINVSYK